jgi:hypothetical protein
LLLLLLLLLLAAYSLLAGNALTGNFPAAEFNALQNLDNL